MRLERYSNNMKAIYLLVIGISLFAGNVAHCNNALQDERDKRELERAIKQLDDKEQADRDRAKKEVDDEERAANPPSVGQEIEGLLCILSVPAFFVFVWLNAKFKAGDWDWGSSNNAQLNRRNWGVSPLLPQAPDTPENSDWEKIKLWFKKLTGVKQEHQKQTDLEPQRSEQSRARLVGVDGKPSNPRQIFYPLQTSKKTRTRKKRIVDPLMLPKFLRIENGTIRFECGNCSQSIEIDETGGGMEIKCPGCGEKQTVPTG
jgi:DNA-directed RNA polymerase subunit RPC12/RpoP